MRTLVAILAFVALSQGLLYSQEAPAAAEAPAQVETTPQEAPKSLETVDISNLAEKSDEELVTYMASLPARDFAVVVYSAVVSANRGLARRVINAANTVLSQLPEDNELRKEILANLKEMKIPMDYQRNIIRAPFQPPETLLKGIDAEEAIQNSISLPPEDPAYSAYPGIYYE